MKVNETVKITTQSAKRGIVKLKRPALYGSVKLTFLGKEIHPIGYTPYGDPIISAKQMRMIQIDTNQKNYLKSENLEPEVQASYETREIHIDEKVCNTKEGIAKFLKNSKKLSDLHELLVARENLGRICGYDKLKQFVIFKHYLLDTSEIKVLCPDNKNILSKICNVETYEDYVTKVGYSYHFEGNFDFPEDSAICPICGRKLKLEDLKTDSFVFNSGSYNHNSCNEILAKKEALELLTCEIMNYVYESCPYEVLDDTKYTLSLKFLTPDGDIIMSTKDKKIVIEFTSTFKNFSPIIFGRYLNPEEKRVIVVSEKNTAFSHLVAAQQAVKNQ